MDYGNYPDLKSIKKILVIKLRHLGDVLLTSPIFKELKNKMPWAEVDVFIYKEGIDVLKGNENISEILFYDRSKKTKNIFIKIKEDILSILKVRKKKYDLVLNLTEGDRGAILAKFSKAKILIGYLEDLKWWKKKIYTHFVKKPNLPRHTVEKNLDFIRRIGIFPKNKDLYFHIPENDYLHVKKFLESKNFFLKDFVLIHPTSRWRFKCYPHFNGVAKRLIERGEKIVFVSGPKDFEKKFLKNILKDLDDKNILIFPSSIKELAALIKMSKILICVDSLPLHIASSLKVKCISLFGPTSDKNWGPWQNEKAKVICKNVICRPCNLDGCGGSKISDCMHQISEKEILDCFDTFFN